MVPGRSTDTWKFELYVNDDTRRSAFVQENLRAFCSEYLKGSYHIEVIDLVKHPELGFLNNICVTPTLIRRHPSPERTLVGDLSDTDKIMDYLNIARPKKGLSVKTTFREGLRKQGAPVNGLRK